MFKPKHTVDSVIKRLENGLGDGSIDLRIIQELEGMKRKKPIMNSERFRFGISIVLAVLLFFLIPLIISPMQKIRSSQTIVTKDGASLPEMEDTVKVSKPPSPPPSMKETPTTTTTRRESPTPRPQKVTSNTPVATRDYTPSQQPGSSLSGVRKIVGGSGGFRGGTKYIPDSTADEGEGFADQWRPPFAKSGVNPDVVHGQKTQVIITRLKHSMSNYQVYDDSLRQLENALNENNPEMQFSIYLQQSFSPYGGHVLLMIGEYPQLASEGGRVIGGSDSLRPFTPTERTQLKTYIENGGILLIMEATPYGGEDGFSKIVERELGRIQFEDGWKKFPIFFAGDLIQEFNQHNRYDSLAEVLTVILGREIN